MIKKILTSPWMALITLALVVGIRIEDPDFVTSVRMRYFDTLITSREATDSGIATVNIDESTLKKYGQWPLDRRVYAQLIDDLYKRNAGLVVFTVLMSETDRQGGDAALGAMMAQRPVVLTNIPHSEGKNKPRVPGSAVINSEYADQIVNYPALIANVPLLESRAVGVGSAHTLPEVDGVVRRVPLVVAVDGRLYPSLAMEVTRIAAGDTTFQVKLNEIGVEKMRVPSFSVIPTDNLGRVWIDWSKGTTAFSMSDLPADFGGAVVVVGVTAAGIGNPVPTARGAVWPHELQASVIGTMLSNVTIVRPDWADGAEILLVGILGIFLVFFAYWRKK